MCAAGDRKLPDPPGGSGFRLVKSGESLDVQGDLNNGVFAYWLSKGISSESI